MLFMALFLFGCSTSETDAFDLVDETVTESKSIEARGIANAPAQSGTRVIRFEDYIAVLLVDEKRDLTATFGLDSEAWCAGGAPFIGDTGLIQLILNDWGGNLLIMADPLTTVVYKGVPNWPVDGACVDCCGDEGFFETADILATGMSKAIITDNGLFRRTNTWGGSFHGRLELEAEDGGTANLSAWFRESWNEEKQVFKSKEAVMLN